MSEKLVQKTCPLCEGSGVVLEKQTFSPEQRKQARLLRRQGMSYRKIGEQLGIEHPQRVKSMIRANQ